jgi:hypothetical protein
MGRVTLLSVAQQSPALRVATPTILTAVLASGLAIVINLATEWKRDLWPWVVVAALTVATAAVALWLARAEATGETDGDGTVRGDVSIKARDRSVAAWRMRDVTIRNDGPGEETPDPR